MKLRAQSIISLLELYKKFLNLSLNRIFSGPFLLFKIGTKKYNLKDGR
jgi:hypothetical protein